MFIITMDLILSAADRQVLTGMLRATTISAGLARRARVILALADGQSCSEIASALSVTDTYIARWKQRVVAGGLPALGDLPRSGRPDRLDPRLEAKILAKTQEPPRVTMHYTPTYSSWLNQIELWFAKIERDMIARGIFTSTADLRCELMQYIRQHSKLPTHPVGLHHSEAPHSCFLKLRNSPLVLRNSEQRCALNPENSN